MSLKKIKPVDIYKKEIKTKYGFFGLKFFFTK